FACDIATKKCRGSVLIPARGRKKNTPIPQRLLGAAGRGAPNSGTTCLTALTAWSYHHAISCYRFVFGCVFGPRRLLHCGSGGRSPERRQRAIPSDRLPRGHATPRHHVLDQSQAAELRASAGAAGALGRRGSLGLDRDLGRRRPAGGGGA